MEWLATYIKVTRVDRWLLAAVGVLVPTIAVLAIALRSNPAVGELARLLVAPPSLAAPFLGGLFARRGGAIVGLLMGLWAALAALLLIVAIPAYQSPATLAALLLVPLVAVTLGTVGTAVRQIFEVLGGMVEREGAAR